MVHGSGSGDDYCQRRGSMEWLIWRCSLAGKMKYKDGTDRWKKFVAVGVQVGLEW